MLAGLKAKVRDRLCETLAAHQLRRRRLLDGDVAVAGLLSSAVGIGEAARLTIRGLERIGVKTSAFDLRERFPVHRALDAAPRKPVAASGGGTLVVQINPREFPDALLELGERIRHRRIVGYWAWELPRLPALWRRRVKLADSIWVPSEFAADAVRRSANRVWVVPHPVEKPERSSLGRNDFGLPRNKPVFLVMFDLYSSMERKNPIGAIRAFREAFPVGEAHLCVKTNHFDRAPEHVRANLLEHVKSRRDISLITETLSPHDLAALISCCNALVSLHRSEGFGLTLAEAMSLGTTVVATRWSGNIDFMTDENSLLVDSRLIPAIDRTGVYPKLARAQWAEPDLGQAVEHLRRVSTDKTSLLKLQAEAEALPAKLIAGFESAVMEALALKSLRAPSG